MLTFNHQSAHLWWLPASSSGSAPCLCFRFHFRFWPIRPLQISKTDCWVTTLQVAAPTTDQLRHLRQLTRSELSFSSEKVPLSRPLSTHLTHLSRPWLVWLANCKWRFERGSWLYQRVLVSRSSIKQGELLVLQKRRGDEERSRGYESYLLLPNLVSCHTTGKSGAAARNSLKER